MRAQTLLTPLSVILLFSFIYTFHLQAQDSNTPVRMNGYNVYVASSLDTFIAEEAKPDAFDGYYYRLMQFEDIPSASDREALKDAGLRFLDYLPEKAYFVAFPVDFDRTLLQGYPIHGIISPEAAWKLAETLQSPPYPAWAVRGEQDIVVNAVFYRHVDVLRATDALLQQVSAELLKRSKVTGSTRIQLPQADLQNVAALPFVQYVEPVDPPSEPENYTSRTLSRSNVIAPDHGLSTVYDGKGVSVMLQDDGTIGPHIDYQGRIGAQYTSGTWGDHGDRIAGKIMGAGNRDPRTRGFAFASELYVYPVYDGIDSLPAHYYKHDIRITSTSYSNGCNAGYTNFTRTHDQLVREQPALIHVFSAGNSGSSNCNYGAGSWWGNVTGGHKVGTNVIATANLNDIDELTTSSSRGPAHDGRIKPDLATKGTGSYTTTDTNEYAFGGGTSLACPGVTGTLAQLYHAYEDLNGSPVSESGLIKAMLMNTADDLGNPGPDFKFGWGRINGRRGLNVISNDWYLTDSADQGNTNVHSINVPTGVAEFRVMTYWTDYEAVAGADKALVNDLDIWVVKPGGDTVRPWVLNHFPHPDSLDKPAVRGLDTLNNVEQVTIEAPLPGTYEVIVTGSSVPMGPQKYFVVWELVEDELVLTHPQGGEHIEPGSDMLIRWDAYGANGTFDLEYSVDSGASWTTITTGLDDARRHYEWSPTPTTVSGNVLVRISRGIQTDVSDTTFSFMDTPSNLQVDWACPDSFRFSWNSLPSADYYEVFMLDTMYMEPVDTTGQNSMVIYGIDMNETYWISVRAYGDNGRAVSPRAIAIEKAPGLWGCPFPLDAYLLNVIAPPTASCGLTNSEAVTLRVRNAGVSDTLFSFDAGYRVDGGTPVTETFNTPLPPGDTINYTFNTTASFAAPGIYEVAAWVDATDSGDVNPFNDSLFNQAVTHLEVVSTYPLVEDAEGESLCGVSSFDCVTQGTCPLNSPWLNTISGDIDWSVGAGETASSETGPGVDHTLGTTNGQYFFTEASSCYGQEAILLSPCFDTDKVDELKLSLWYHMYGVEMGNLLIEADTGSGDWVFLEGRIGAQHTSENDPWSNLEVDIPIPIQSNFVKLRLRGETGSFFRSDIAVDDIAVCPVPKADFAFQIDGMELTLNDQSSHVTGYFWSMGDGTAYTSSEPVHNYSGLNTYDVCQVVSNPCGSDTLCQEITLTGTDAPRDPQVNVYPNPASNTVTIRWDAAMPSGDVLLRVTDVSGKQMEVVRPEDQHVHTYQLNVQDWAGGVYFLEVVTPESVWKRRFTVVK